MKYLSICSGIEAASVAWHPLGWEPLAFSEIEAFPRAVLAHHYPGVPLHGDFTTLRHEAWISDADVLVGGTPCQAFSVAGLRKSLGDDRGNLSLEFIRLADSIDAAREAQGRDPSVIVWENVPGVLSVKDNAFGCFLAALAGDVTPYIPPRGKWTDAGLVAGPQRTVAWRILDAQYFGLAQRRRRVFVVASARDGFDPATVLLEREGLRRDSPPSREAGQGFAHPVAPCLTSGGRGVERTGETRGQDPIVAVPVPSTGDISHCLNAGGMGRQDYETETLIAHALRAEGFDASEDGTGRGTPLVPVQAFYSTESRCDHFPPVGLSPPLKVGSNGGGQPPAIAFSSKDHGADASQELSPTLRAMPHDASHANGGGQMAVAVSLRGRDGGSTAELGDEVQNCLRASSGGGDKPHVLASMAVRRLTPVECERLQGFPDGYTMIPWRGKPAEDCPDGPRYKALGNSMAVPVMRWIGERIAEAVQ